MSSIALITNFPNSVSAPKCSVAVRSSRNSARNSARSFWAAVKVRRTHFRVWLQVQPQSGHGVRSLIGAAFRGRGVRPACVTKHLLPGHAAATRTFPKVGMWWTGSLILGGKMPKLHSGLDRIDGPLDRVRVLDYPVPKPQQDCLELRCTR